MRIGQLAKSCGCPVETIRFYESEDLLPKAPRSIGNYRIYDQKHQDRLRFILHCRALDLSLEEIRQLIGLSQSKEAEIAHQIVERHLETIKEKMKELQILQKDLEALQNKCTCGHKPHEHCGLLEGLQNGAA